MQCVSSVSKVKKDLTPPFELLSLDQQMFEIPDTMCL